MSDLGNAPTSVDDVVRDAIPSQVLARWAAMAGERACVSAVLPTQVLRAV